MHLKLNIKAKESKVFYFQKSKANESKSKYLNIRVAKIGKSFYIVKF